MIFRACRRLSHLIFGACSLGTQFWESITRKHFDEILLKHFRRTKLAFQMLCNEIGSSFKLSHCKVTCLLWCALRNWFGKFVAIVVICMFSCQMTNVSDLLEHTRFYAHFYNLCASWRFHPTIFMRYPKMWITNCWMETQLMSQDPSEIILVCKFMLNTNISNYYQCWNQLCCLILFYCELIRLCGTCQFWLLWKSTVALQRDCYWTANLRARTILLQKHK